MENLNVAIISSIAISAGFGFAFAYDNREYFWSTLIGMFCIFMFVCYLLFSLGVQYGQYLSLVNGIW